MFARQPTTVVALEPLDKQSHAAPEGLQFVRSLGRAVLWEHHTSFRTVRYNLRGDAIKRRGIALVASKSCNQQYLAVNTPTIWSCVATKKIRFERTNPLCSCECGIDDGSQFRCHPRNRDCQHCLPNGDCFSHQVVHEVDYKAHDGNVIRFVSNTYEYSSVTTSKSPSSYDVGTVVAVSSNDGLCAASINGRPCKACSYVTCLGYDIPNAYNRAVLSNMLQVDCSNIEEHGSSTPLLFDACDERTWNGILRVFQPLPACR